MRWVVCTATQAGGVTLLICGFSAVVLDKRYRSWLRRWTVESVHIGVFGFDLCVCGACFGVRLRCCTQVFTLALGLGLRTLACWRQLQSVSRCGLSSALFGSLVALPLAPNTAVAWPTEQSSVCVCVYVCGRMFVLLYLLDTDYQNTHSPSKVRTFLPKMDIVAGPQFSGWGLGQG